MSNASSKAAAEIKGLKPPSELADHSQEVQSKAPWPIYAVIIMTLVSFFISQALAGFLVGLYPVIRHWTNQQSQDWLNNAVAAQFFFILLAESLSIAILWLYWRRFKQGIRRALGLLRRPRLSDVAYAFVGAGAYFVVYIASVIILSNFVTINTNPQQDVGFQSARGFGPLLITYISLAVLPPIAEEIMFRGFLYSGLRRKLRPLAATLLTSCLFAVPHLFTGMPGAGLLWLVGLDTFILSLMLCYLREKTGALYSGMVVHSLKNSLAFVTFFLIH